MRDHVPGDHPNYRNPQVAEALCEIHYALAPEHPWKPTAPGDLFKRFQTDYPELEPISEQGVILSIGPDGAPIQQLVAPKLRFKLKHATEPYLIQISQQNFTFNALQPYPGWVKFRAEIAKRWPDLVDVVKPATVTRIGLRYINRIIRLSAQEKPAYWFNPSDYVATAALQSEAGFLNRMESRLSAENRVLVTLAHDQSTVDNAKYGAVLLDIDVIVEKEIPAHWPKIIEEMRQLNQRAWHVFDQLRGPNLDALLNKEPPK